MGLLRYYRDNTYIYYLKQTTMATTTVNKQFTLNVSDFVKGLIMAVLTPVFAIIADSINKGSLTFDWKLIGIAAIGGILAYLTKNFLSPTTTTISNQVPPTK